jgi:hypothetical protein
MFQARTNLDELHSHSAFSPTYNSRRRLCLARDAILEGIVGWARFGRGQRSLGHLHVNLASGWISANQPITTRRSLGQSSSRKMYLLQSHRERAGTRKLNIYYQLLQRLSSKHNHAMRCTISICTKKMATMWNLCRPNCARASPKRHKGGPGSEVGM